MNAIAGSDSPSLRKARGAFFTPGELSDFVAAWAVRRASDVMLEPSCGEAAFLLSVGARVRELGDSSPRRGQLQGVELHEVSARSASRFLASNGLSADIAIGNFFDRQPVPEFDVVAGNPPYVRYQGFSGEDRHKSQTASLRQGVRLSGLANSWASFVVHASAFLKEDGRLGLVLPAELLSVNYAGPVRAFLLDRFAVVRLVVFEERVFPGVLEEVVLLLAEGQGPATGLHIHHVRDGAGLTGDLSDLPVQEFRPAISGGKWTTALLPTDSAEAYSRVLASDGVVELASWGDPDLGMVTGSNRFFTLSAESVSRYSLPESELLPISPPGSKHLRGLAFGSRDWRRMREAGDRVYLFYPGQRTISSGARRLIHEGEEQGVSDAYKCRVRSPWWLVPLVPIPDLFLTYMNHDAPRLVTNGAGVRHVNSVHGLVLAKENRMQGRQLLPIAMLNSLTMLAVETLGRSYGGGILKIEPREANAIPMPSPTLLQQVAPELRLLRKPVSALLVNKDLEAATRLVDEVLLTGALAIDEEEIEALRRGRKVLFGRRSSRSARA